MREQNGLFSAASEHSAVEALAALRLLYSEEEDGWYLGEAVEDRELIEKLLREAME